MQTRRNGCAPQLPHVDIVLEHIQAWDPPTRASRAVSIVSTKRRKSYFAMNATTSAASKVVCAAHGRPTDILLNTLEDHAAAATGSTCLAHCQLDAHLNFCSSRSFDGEAASESHGHLACVRVKTPFPIGC